MKSVAALTQLTILPGETVPIVYSWQIAQAFGKEHKNILRNIRDLIKECPSQFSRLNFKPTNYLDEQGKNNDCYTLTQDGFCMLGMGLNGPQAIMWKLRYIAEFNKRGQIIQEQQRQIQEMERENELKLLVAAEVAASEARLIRRGLGFARRLTPARRREIRAAARYAALGLGYAEIGRLLGCGAEKARNLQREGAWLKGGAPVMNAPTTSFPRRAAAHAGISLPRKGGAQ